MDAPSRGRGLCFRYSRISSHRTPALKVGTEQVIISAHLTPADIGRALLTRGRKGLMERFFASAGVRVEKNRYVIAGHVQGGMNDAPALTVPSAHPGLPKENTVPGDCAVDGCFLEGVLWSGPWTSPHG